MNHDQAYMHLLLIGNLSETSELETETLQHLHPEIYSTPLLDDSSTYFHERLTSSWWFQLFISCILEVYIVSGPVKLKIEQQVSHHHLLLLLDRRIVTNQIVYGWSAARMHTHHTHTHTWHQQTLSLFARVHCICSCSAGPFLLLSSLFPSSVLLIFAVVLQLHGHTTTCRDLINTAWCWNLS